MKKILRALLTGIFSILSVCPVLASDCLNLRFNNGDNVCLEISKDGSKDFNLSISKSNLGKNSTLKCYIILPNSTMYTFDGCKGNFYYAGTNTKDVTISATYVTQNKDFYSKRIPTEINFTKGTWGTSNNISSSSSSSNSDEIELSTNRKSPSTSQYVNLTIETDKKYTGKLYLSAKYRSSSSSSWSNISNTSSTYFSDYSNTWSNEYYKMTSSDKGNVTLNNLIKFRKNGYYRIYVKDTDGNESYIQFNVGETSSSNEELRVTASPSNPDTYEWVKLTIQTDDDYVGKINFSKLQYKSSSSSSWSTISSRTSSTYVSDYSSTWSNGYYKMTSSDDGEVTLKNLLKFKKSGYYRIYVEDTDGNESYVQIDVDVSSSSSSSNSDEIELSTNRKSPSTSQYVNLTIETDKKYTGKLYLSAKYRSSSSSSWSSISNTSSTYFSDYSNNRSNGYYKMTSSDKGNVTLNSLIKFKKNGYYRVYVEDVDGNESYIQFNVGNSDDDDDESGVSGFTTSELSKVKSVYKEWDNMIGEMQRKYPSLKNDNYRVKLSENLYNDMKDIINNKRYRDLDDYEEFKEAFDEWYKYTIRNI